MSLAESPEATFQPVAADTEAAEPAAPILARAAELIASLTNAERESHDAIRYQLKVVRADLFNVVLARHNGDRDAAVESSDFESDFRKITAAIEPPKQGTSRPFPGREPQPQGERVYG